MAEQARTMSIAQRKRETAHCAECGRDIDIRGIRAHQEKHQREAMERLAKGTVMPVAADLNGDGKLVEAFRLGLKLGRKAA